MILLGENGNRYFKFKTESEENITNDVYFILNKIIVKDDVPSVVIIKNRNDDFSTVYSADEFESINSINKENVSDFYYYKDPNFFIIFNPEYLKDKVCDMKLEIFFDNNAPMKFKIPSDEFTKSCLLNFMCNEKNLEVTNNYKTHWMISPYLMVCYKKNIYIKCSDKD